MPEDNTRDGLRVGGWIPPYSPGGDAAGQIRPSHRPAFGGRGRPGGPLSRSGGSGLTRPRLVLAASICLACAATAAVAVLLDASRGPEPVAAEFTYPQRMAPFDPSPPPAETTGDVPVSVQPSPSVTSTAAPSTVPTRRYTTTPPTSPVATRTTTSPPSATTAPVSLTVGSTAGLESADHPGHRVRHRDYRARLDRIGSTDSDAVQADSNFRVRTGLAGSGCVSLESVNFPGYYLRHRNFVIRLDRNDGTELFRQDASFCPVTSRGGAALALRSLNFPGHFVVTGRDSLRIAETSAARALALEPRPAL